VGERAEKKDKDTEIGRHRDRERERETLDFMAAMDMGRLMTR